MRPGLLLDWSTRSLPGFDPELRRELSESVTEAARSGGRRDRAAELLGLIGLSFTMQARRGTGDDRVETVRQGMRLAALVLAVQVYALELAHGRLVAAALAAAVGIVVAAGTRWVPVVLAAPLVVLTGFDGGVSLVMAAGLAMTAAIGTPHDGRRCRRGACLATVGMAGLAAVGPHLPAAATVAVAAAGAAVVGAFLLLGWFDPRYAVAATVISAIRLASTAQLADFDVWAAVASTSPPGGFFVRLALMIFGVTTGWLVASRALDRCVGPAI
ncbi:MAG: hypothetical protein ACK5PP_05100 [Acidimicrobiales bacterium]